VTASSAGSTNFTRRGRRCARPRRAGCGPGRHLFREGRLDRRSLAPQAVEEAEVTVAGCPPGRRRRAAALRHPLRDARQGRDAPAISRPRRTRDAARSWESIRFWTGVREAFSASRAWICASACGAMRSWASVRTAASERRQQAQDSAAIREHGALRLRPWKRDARVYRPPRAPDEPPRRRCSRRECRPWPQCLVTGGSGFVGRRVAPFPGRPRSRGHRAGPLPGRGPPTVLADLGRTPIDLRREGFEHVYHVAGLATSCRDRGGERLFTTSTSRHPGLLDGLERCAERPGPSSW